jgi:hypothetical protein
MNALRVLFRTDRFNLSKVGAHFINPCCFGEDVAIWLRGKLIEKGATTRDPYQEDWGWELPADLGNHRYYVCIGGNADSPETGSDEGEWGVILEKKRSLAQRLTGTGKIAADDPMLQLIEAILRKEPAIKEVHREAR